MRLLTLVAVLAMIAACGSTTDAGDGGTKADGSETHEAGADSGGDAALDCNALYAQLDPLRTKATACNAQGSPCKATVPDACCLLTVTSAGSPEAQAFESAISNFIKSCPGECPITCPPEPTGICGQGGHCAQ